MKLRFIFILSIGFLFTSTVYAQTVVQSIITSNQNWKASAGPFILNGNVLIDSGFTVSVEPGTHIRSEGNFRIIVQGAFKAVGTASSVITIDSTNFEFAKGAVGYDFSTSSGSSFQYCVFNGLSLGGNRMVETKGPNVFISNCELNSCYYCVYGYGPSTAGDTIELRIENSVFNGDGNGYVVYLSNNTKLEMEEVSASHMGSMFVGVHASIISSSFYSFGYFSGFRINGSKHLVLHCNNFRKFSHYLLDMSYISPTAFVEITNNTFDSAGILLNYRSSAVLTNFLFQNNNMLSYTENSVNCGTGSNPGSYFLFNLEDNYWGTTDTNLINDGIFDFTDDITAVSKVNFAGFLSSAVADCSGGNIGSVNGLNTIEYSLYPNPASQSIRISGISEPYQVQIINNKGEEVLNRDFEEGEAQINIVNFSAGIYLIRISTAKGIATKKLLIVN